MTNLIVLLGGVVGCGAGWIAAAAATLLFGGYFGLSNFEGARDMTALFGIGPLGGLAGLIVGVWLALRYRNGTAGGALALLGRLLLVAVAITSVAVLALGAMSWFNPILNPNGPAPRLAFEIRLPAGAAPDGLEITLLTEKNAMPATLDATATRRDGDRPIVVGAVDLYYRSPWRLLELKRAGVPEYLFSLGLRARPAHETDFRDWERVSQIDHTADQASTATEAEAEAYDIRYRVVWPEGRH